MVDNQRNKAFQKGTQESGQAANQKDNRATYRNLVKNLPCVVHQLVMGADGSLRFAYIGDNCHELFGYTADELMADANLVFGQIPEPDSDIVIRALKDSAKKLTRYDVEHRFLKNTGETVWIHVSANPRHGVDSDTIWDGIGLEITERKMSEAGLEKHRRILFEAEKLADVGGWEWDTVEDKWTMSDNWLQIHGCPNRQLTSSELLRIAHPDDRSIIQEAFRRAAENGEPYRIEHRIVRQDTRDVRYIRAYGDLKLDQSGNTVKVYGVAQDITDRKQTELALKDSEKRYRAVVESQSEVISRVKTDGTFTFVNEAYCRFFGKSESDLIGQKWFPVAHPDDLPNINRRLEELSIENPEVVIENRVWDTQGRLRWMQFINHGFFDDRGNLYEIQSVGRDTTELKEKEQLIHLREREIREKTADLKKTNNALEVLLERRHRQIEALKDDIYRNYSKLILPELNDLKNRLKLSSNKKTIALILNLFESMVSADTAPLTSGRFGLTKTEIRIAAMILNGMTSSEIANHLSISINTVGFHRKNLRKKLGIHRSTIELSQYLKQHLKNHQ